MPHNEPQAKIAQCPECGARNFGFASFCIACGEPLDGVSDTPPSFTPNPPYRANDTAKERRRERPTYLPALNDLARRFFSRWQSWAGLLAFGLLLAYVAYDWQMSAAESDAYRDGMADAQAKDWDRAAAKFNLAGDLRDAKQKSNDAHQQAQKRDHLYDQGTHASSRGDWHTAITALEQVQTIQPAYSDSADRLAQAKDHVLNQGLDGITYLVGDGPAPGLYVRNERGRTLHLDGSDKYSTIRAASPDGKSFIYDRPSSQAEYNLPGSNANPLAPDPFGPNRAERFPALIRLDDSGVVNIIDLPQLGGAGTGVFARNGLWWYTPQPSTGASGYEVYFDSQYSWAAVRVSDLMQGRRVVATDPPRSRVIIAEEIAERGDPTWSTRLYLAGATGDTPSLLVNAPGEVYQASISAGGRWLLYVTQRNLTDVVRTAWAIPLDPENGGEAPHPRKLETLEWSGVQSDVSLSAAFVPTDHVPAKIVVSRIKGNSETLTVYDPDTARPEVVWPGWSAGTLHRNLSAFSLDGLSLASRRQEVNRTVLQVLTLKPGAADAQSVYLQATPDQTVQVQFAPRNDYVVASVQNPDSANRGHTQAVYAAHEENGGRLREVKLIATATMTYDSDMPAVALPIEGSLLAYVNPSQELHTVFYDGTGDTLLASNVKAVWSLKARRDLSWWR